MTGKLTAVFIIVIILPFFCLFFFFGDGNGAVPSRINNRDSHCCFHLIFFIFPYFLFLSNQKGRREVLPRPLFFLFFFGQEVSLFLSWTAAVWFLVKSMTGIATATIIVSHIFFASLLPLSTQPKKRKKGSATKTSFSPLFCGERICFSFLWWRQCISRSNRWPGWSLLPSSCFPSSPPNILPSFFLHLFFWFPHDDDGFPLVRKGNHLIFWGKSENRHRTCHGEPDWLICKIEISQVQLNKSGVDNKSEIAHKQQKGGI